MKEDEGDEGDEKHFCFLMERLPHTSMQKEKETDKEGWFQKKVMECGPEKRAREGRAWRQR